MSEIDRIIGIQHKLFSKQFERLVIARLKEMGYDTKTPRHIFLRLSSIPQVHSKVRLLYIDFSQDSMQLIAKYTEPEAKLTGDPKASISIEFKFSPMPKAI